MTASSAITAVELHTYFGPEDSPLFGAVHVPADHRVRGAVILCGSLAKEHMDTVRGLRFLAEALANRGFLALRFDYLGVGDSADEQVRNDSVARWKQSIGHAVDYVRQCGVEEIAAVGLRAGTLLLDSVLREQPRIGSVVYWDPVGRGKAFLREQQTLYRLTVGSDDTADGNDEEIPLIGATMSVAAAKEFGDLELGRDPDPVRRALVVRRPEGADKRVKALEASASVTVEIADGLEHFTQPSSFLVKIPTETVGGIADWIDVATSKQFAAVEPVVRTTAQIRLTAGEGGHVVETIEKLGGKGLFAIRARPANAHGELRTAMFFSTANDTHIGPNREWVDLGRGFAAAGGQSLRWDRTGAGESGSPAAKMTGIYTQEAIDQALEIGDIAATDPRSLLVVGVCSGSWYAAYVARSLGVGSVVLINAIAWSWRRKSAMTGEIEPDDLGVPRSDPEWQKTPRARVKRFLQTHLPYRLWLLLGKRGVTQVPEVLLRPLVSRGVPTTVILSPHDQDWFVGQRGPESLERLARRGQVPRMITTEIGDHTAYHSTVRAAVRQTVLAWASPADTEVAVVSRP